MCIKNRLSGEKCVPTQVCKVAYLIVDFFISFFIYIIKAGFVIVFFFFFCFVFFFFFCFLFVCFLFCFVLFFIFVVAVVAFPYMTPTRLRGDCSVR